MKSPRVVRSELFELALDIKCPHIAPSLSTVEILCSVYGMVGPNDKFILSKGHGCLAWYIILKDLGYDPPLRHHPDIDVTNGIECTTGSLGHGLPMGVGMALAKKMRGDHGMVFVLMGDGECQEGTTWESALIASQHKLDNLCVIVDHNKLQTLGRIRDVVNLGDLGSKFVAFDFQAIDCDGHNVDRIDEALKVAITNYMPKGVDKPKVIVAHTVKGKGLSFMEGNSIFHARLPNDEETVIARKELS